MQHDRAHAARLGSEVERRLADFPAVRESAVRDLPGAWTFVSIRALSLLVAVTFTSLSAYAKRETPVGLILASAGATIVPAGSETPLALKPGEILFAGDVLRSGGSAATFLFCPVKAVQSLAPASEVLLQANQAKVRTGKIADVRTAESCFLPSVLHVATASQQHYGVSMFRALNSGEEAKPVPRDQLNAAIQAELAPLDTALANDPKDTVASIARAAVFEKHNLPANALEEYRRLSSEFGDAVWMKGKIFELQEALALAAAATPAASGGKTYALLIGISQYQKLPKESWLQYANADALTFDQFLRSPRGGGLSSNDIVLLVDEQASTAAIRNGFQTFLKARAGKADSIVILIAAHGTVEAPGTKGAYIVTYDTDPQDLAATALPMVEVQDLVQTGLSRVGRVTLFADVCRAGSIGSIHSTTVNATVEKLGEAEGEILGIMASRPKELSREGPEFGGGHGAFSYYLLKGLSGAADKNGDGMVDVNELIEYVRREVAQATGDKQHPRDFGTAGSDIALADVKKPGIPISALPVSRWPVVMDAHHAPLQLASAAPSFLPDTTVELERFAEALRAGRILTQEPDNAFTALRSLAGHLSPSDYLATENQLRIALENRGQQVLLRYLEGDQVPQREADFVAGARYFEAALQLTPESLYLKGRLAFCRGRALLFEKKFHDASQLLELSVRIDPNGAYAYNALGIAYLEQSDYMRALPAFRDAIRRAPQWTYPLHNLALASIEAGDYTAAQKNFEKAIQLTPQSAYLHYNLGVLHQRLNRREDAELEYRTALQASPELADAYNALGSLEAGDHKLKQAERDYREALQKDPHLLAARQNLALLLFEGMNRKTEGVQLWRENVALNPEFLPSRISLAEALAKQGEPAAAITEYREVLRQKPDYVAARVALADLLQSTHALEAARDELQEAIKGAQQNPYVWEQLGNVQAALHQSDQANHAYRAALSFATDRAMRKRLRARVEAR